MHTQLVDLLKFNQNFSFYNVRFTFFLSHTHSLALALSRLLEFLQKKGTSQSYEAINMQFEEDVSIFGFTVPSDPGAEK